MLSGVGVEDGATPALQTPVADTAADPAAARADEWPQPPKLEATIIRPIATVPANNAVPSAVIVSNTKIRPSVYAGRRGKTG
jgi:hypothetical protein